MNDRLWLWVVKGLPKRALSRLFGKVACQGWTRHFIPLYIKRYKIDTSELSKDIAEYAHLTDFFARQLKAQSRQVAPGEDRVTSPVDGTVTGFGKIDGHRLIQAKGRDYTLEELFRGAEEKAAAFLDGQFLTLYLSPADYHRVHAPVSGRVTEMVYQPGTLFPVNGRGIRLVERLFVNNERVTTFLSTHFGEVAIVKVGAMNVGSVKVAYDENVQTNRKRKKGKKCTYEPPVAVRKGEEIGWFEFGSTVILLFPRHTVTFLPDLKPGSSVRMGETIGRVLNCEGGI